jgi:electron transfer flavoprotein alpha/beta subunit
LKIYMVKILVCFSIVDNTDDVIRSDWEKFSKDNYNIDYTQKIINPYDESAIEYTLRIKDAAAGSGETIHITAVTIGQSLREIIYKNLFAVGVDRIVLLKSSSQVMFDPESTSRILEDFINSGCFDAVFLGQQNSITCNGQTAARLSVYLGLPYIGYITDMGFMGDKLRVKCKTRSGFQTASVPPKGVFSFYNTEHPYLRMATLREKLKVAKKQIEEYDAKTNAGQDEELFLESLSFEPMIRKCRMITGSSTKEKAYLLLKNFLQYGGD